MICDGHILNACFAFKTWARLSKWQRCTWFTYNQTHWICLTSSGSSVECPPPIMFIDKLLFISGREAQDTGQMQPPFDRKTLCGSHHHWKGVFFCLLYQLLQSASPIVGWRHLKYIKAHGATEDLLRFISGSEFERGAVCAPRQMGLGLYFQDNISENAACGTVDGNTTVGTLGDVIVRLKLDHKIMTGPMSSHFCCTTQNRWSISGLTIHTGQILNPRLTNFSIEHWFRLRFLKMDTSALVLLVISFLFAHISLYFLNVQKQQNADTAAETSVTSPHSLALTDWHVASHTGGWQGH